MKQAVYTTNMGNLGYKSFYENNPEGIWLLGLDSPIPTNLPTKKQVELLRSRGYIAKANKSFAAMHEVESIDDIIGNRISEIIDKYNKEMINYFAVFVESGYRTSGVFTQNKTKLGENVYFHNSLIGEIENNRLLRAWGIQSDMTDHYQALESLRKSEERLALALQASNMGHWEWNLENNQYIWSDELKKLFGLESTDELSYEKYINSAPKEDRLRIEKSLNKAMKNGGEHNLERRVVWPDGSVHWILSMGKFFFKNKKAVRFLGTCMNIDYRKMYELRLQESEQRFRNMADTTPMLIWVSDINKLTTYFNKPWYEYTGNSAAEEQGNGWIRGIHPEDVDRCLKIYDAAFDKRKPFTIEYRLRRHDGVYRTVLDSGAPRFSYNNEFLGYIGSCVDIEDVKRTKQKSTELKEINRKLHEQREQLIDLNKSKDEFISLASHQLRTPATGVKQYLGMMLEGYSGKLSTDQIKMIKTAYDSNDRQLSIINDLLRVAQVDAGKVVLKKTKTDIVKLVKDAINEHSNTYKQLNQKIIYKHSRDKIYAHVDSNKIRMVVDNLIDNASKYTPNGKNINISVKDNQKSVSVAIKDEGIGINANDIPHLFQKFLRLDNPQTKNVEGSGLGLYWVKKIIDLHQANLRVRSTPKMGSTFTINLPKQ